MQIELMYALKHAWSHCIAWRKDWEDFGDLLWLCESIHFTQCVDSFYVIYKLLEVKRHSWFPLFPLRASLSPPRLARRMFWNKHLLVVHWLHIWLAREYDEELNSPSQLQRSDMSSFFIEEELHTFLSPSSSWRVLSSLCNMSLIWSAKDRLTKKITCLHFHVHHTPNNTQDSVLFS